MSAEIIGDPHRRNFIGVCQNIFNRILVLIPAIAFIIFISGMAQAFEDDFSTDKEGWISLPPGSIAHDSSENNVHWQVSRSSDQRMYHAIDPLNSDFKMSLDAVIDGASNNCYIDMGLLGDINDISKNNLYLRIGYYGGGTPYHHWYACVTGKYNDGTAFTSLTGEVTPAHDTLAGYAPINQGQWYSYELEKTGSIWHLNVFDKNTMSLIKSFTGTLSGTFSPFNYVYFGNSDTNDWPSANGKLDNLEIGNRVSGDIFETDFESYTTGTTPTELYIYYNGAGNSYQVISEDVSHSGSKSFQVWGRPSWCSNVHYYFTKPESGRIGYQVWVKANPKEEGGVQFVNPEGATWSWGWGGISFNQDGYITAPGGFKRLHNVDKWYQVRAEMDVESGACWIWLDDELVTDGITPAEDGIVNPDAYKGVRGVIFLDCSWYENPSTPIYFDDFRFYIVPSSVSVVAEANGPYGGFEGSPIIFDASGSYGSGGEPLSYRWDFDGDGNWDTDWSNEATASFTFGDDWNGEAKLEVRDGISIGSDTASVTINNVNPNVKIEPLDQANPSFIFPCDRLKFNGSFSDPGLQDIHMTNWDFGDGSNCSGDINEAARTTMSEHEYDTPGDYEVTLTVTDDDNGIGIQKLPLTVVSNEEALNSVKNFIQELPDDAFDKSNSKQTILNKLSAVEVLAGNGDYFEASKKLKNDVQKKIENSITDPTAKNEICSRLDQIVAHLGKLQFVWCGLTWNSKYGKEGPGNNYWSINNVWLDDEKNLHLKISQSGDRWYCGEIWTKERLPFGRYQWWINSKITQLDKNVVLGMFNYPSNLACSGYDGSNEIDIEITTWGDVSYTNGNYGFFPGDACSAIQIWGEKFSLSHLPILNDYTTHRFDWSSNGVLFQSLQGHRDWGEIAGLIKSSRTPLDLAQRIPQEPLPVHINLWLYKGVAPSDDKPVEVVIEKFEWLSAEEPATSEETSDNIQPKLTENDLKVQKAREYAVQKTQKIQELAAQRMATSNENLYEE